MYAASSTLGPCAQTKRNGENALAAPLGARWTHARTEPPRAIGAKSTAFTNRPTAPGVVASEWKPKTKRPPPGGGAKPAVTPRSTVPVSRPSSMKVQSALPMSCPRECRPRAAERLVGRVVERRRHAGDRDEVGGVRCGPPVDV